MEHMKKLGFLVLALIAALGLIGAAYGAWSKTLTAQATAGTGQLAITIDNMLTNDPTGANDPTTQGSTSASSWNFATNPWTWIPVRASNNKATTVETGAWSWVGSTGTCPVTITMTRNNPSFGGNDYYPSVAIQLRNTGTVPLKVTASVGALPADVSVYYRGGVLGSSPVTLQYPGSPVVPSDNPSTGEINLKWTSPPSNGIRIVTVTVTAKAWTLP
jgi:hypothetical protein